MVTDRAAFADNDRVALIVGQYLSAGGFLNEGEELDLYAAMVAGCADAGHTSVVFKPHPSAPSSQLARLDDVARARDVRLAVADERELPEAWFEHRGVELVGCFSTALLTAVVGGLVSPIFDSFLRTRSRVKVIPGSGSSPTRTRRRPRTTSPEGSAEARSVVFCVSGNDSLCPPSRPSFAT
jgi:hypothetical protein